MRGGPTSPAPAVAATPVACDPKVEAKVALVFGTRHERGALVRCLNVLADEGISLSKLESRPRPGLAWEYVFYVDVEGHVAEPRLQAALTRLTAATQFLRVLGGRRQLGGLASGRRGRARPSATSRSRPASPGRLRGGCC